MFLVISFSHPATLFKFNLELQKVNKLEQRLMHLTRELSNARRDGDEDIIADLEDRIAEVEFELEEEYNDGFSVEWDD